MFLFDIFKICVFLLIIKATFGQTVDHCLNQVYSNICVQLEEKTYLIDGNGNLSWHEAKRFCRRQNGFLANIENQNELDAISNYLVSKNYLSDAHWFWIDGNDLGSEGQFFTTKTGDLMPFKKWSTGQPDNAGGHENCVHLWWRRQAFKMNDAVCGRKQNFICEIYPNSETYYNGN